MISPILNGYLRQFRESWNLNDDESTSFEHFVNFLTISKFIPERFDVEDIHTGGGCDNALDGLAIIVNDRLVFSEEEIDYIAQENRRLYVQFIFIQAKHSSNFDMGDMGKFVFGVKNFFADNSYIPQSEKIKKALKLKNYLIDKFSPKLYPLPDCNMYYATCGKWTDDSTLVGFKKQSHDELSQIDIFGHIDFQTIDASSLQSSYRTLINQIEKSINFEKHTILPSMDKVQEAYLGILPCLEFINLIIDEENKLNKNLFYDNVRDYQGDNPVNSEVVETIEDNSQKDKFVLYNNGVTIVAKSLHKIGSLFTIQDFQIVNGCQTSHILFRNRDRIGQNMYLPVKLIITTDNDVTGQVTKATNRQTPVLIETFESLKPFQKDLEEFYATYEICPKLYYERRSKQYDSESIPQTQIITITSQIKSFMGMFLNEPHSTMRYYGELLVNNRSKLFLEKHKLSIYFCSGYSFYILESMFKKNKIDNRYRKYKYHILMLTRLHFFEGKKYEFNSHQIELICNDIINTLSQQDKAISIFQKAIRDIEVEFTQGYSFDNAYKLRAFTEKILKFNYPSQKELGQINYLNPSLKFGYILFNYTESAYFKLDDVFLQDRFTIKYGDRVLFKRIDNDPKFMESAKYRAIQISIES